MTEMLLLLTTHFACWRHLFLFSDDGVHTELVKHCSRRFFVRVFLNTDKSISELSEKVRHECGQAPISGMRKLFLDGSARAGVVSVVAADTTPRHQPSCSWASGVRDLAAAPSSFRLRTVPSLPCFWSFPQRSVTGKKNNYTLSHLGNSHTQDPKTRA